MRETKTINLALQGGGAHGAFTWGVLERILEEERLVIEGISATSAGAMNAAALKSGLRRNGRDGAKAALADFWTHLSAFAPTIPPVMDWLRSFAPSPAMFSHLADANPAYLTGDLLSRFLSPYEFNPFNINPLRTAVEKMFDAQAMGHETGPKLFVSATNVRTGKIKVFGGAAITADAILASSCLPTLYQAVEIADPETGRLEAYWDGGYSGNPALFPLFYTTQTPDLVVVHINPVNCEDVPDTAQEILNRVNEISFNSSLLAEFRAIEFVQRLIDSGAIARGKMKYLHVHSIADDALMNSLGVASKMSPDLGFLLQLRDAGHAATETFLRDHWQNIGEKGIDLRHAIR